MKAIPHHYKLLAEHPQSYEVHDGKDGRSFHIAKHGMDLGMHVKLSKMKKYSAGGKVTDLPPVPPGMIPGNTLVDPSGVEKALSNNKFSLSEIPITLNPLAGLPSGPSGNSNTITYLPEVPFDQSLLKKPVPASEDSSSESKGSRTEDPLLEALDRSGQIQSLEQQKQTYNDANAAEKLAGQQKAEAYKNYSDDLENLVNPLEIQEQNRKKSDALFEAYQKKDIDPNRVINSMGNGTKIGKIIGLIFGGLGAGQDGENPGITLLNREIERDIDAQKNSQTKSYNLYKMNREATQDDIRATLETREQYLLAVKAKAMQYDSAAAGPVAAAGRAKLIGELDGQINAIQQDKAILQAASGNGIIGIDPAYLVNRISDPHQRQAAIKEINTMKQLKSLKDGMLKAEEELEQMFMGGLLSPNARKAAIGSFSGRAVKLGEGSFTKEQFEQFADNFFRSRTDWGGTTAKKAEYFDDFFKTLAEDSAFKSGTKVGLDKFAATRFKQSPLKTQSGNKIERDDVNKYIRENLGSSDPQVKARVQFLIKKYGIGQ